MTDSPHPGVLPKQELWLILGKGKDLSIWIMWSVQEVRGLWLTVSSKILDVTTAVTVRMQELFVITLAKKHQVIVIKVSTLLGHQKKSDY